MRFLTMALVLGLLTACTQEPKNETTNEAVSSTLADLQLTESQRLNQWFELKFEEQLQLSPMRMTQLGRKDKYTQLDDMSEQGELAKLAWQEATVEELKSKFDYDKLDEDTKVSYDVWIYQYDVAKSMQPFQRRHYVLTQMHGQQGQLPNFLINYHKVENASDLEAYIARIKALGLAINQLTERVSLNADEGVRAPYFAYEGVITESKNLLTGQPFEKDSEQDSALFADFKSEVQGLLDSATIDQVQADQFVAEAKQALISNMQPAYLQLIALFEADLPKLSKEAQGVWSLPNGAAYYDAMLFYRTTTKLSAEQIHQIGLQEVARILSEMEALKTEVGFKGSLQEFFAYIKSDVTDERFYYPNTDEGRQGYLDDATAYLAGVKQKLPEYFGLLPKADLVVKRVEAFREQPGAPQHYSSGTPDGSRSGVYYAHLSDMTMMPKNEMESIAYHEGNPGHHMQISIAQELTGVPTFRKQAFFNSYVEGWALYSETLAKEMGFYQNPYSDFGRLVSEMWRAIRLVVDTGIHSKQWTEQQAIDYFKQNSPISDGAILAEVRRYIVWPGQATSYKIGMLKIIELREKAKQALGDKFDIRQFHDVVLGSGAVPLQILERMVDRWIAQQSTQ